MDAKIVEQIRLIKTAETPEELQMYVCPFFEKGHSEECLICTKSESDLNDCKDYYLEHILQHPCEVWDEDFEKALPKEREKKNPTDIKGIGISCDTCYMYKKCPNYKKGYVCAIDWADNKPENPTDFMNWLIGIQYERVNRASTYERVDGGVNDVGLSAEIDRLHNLVVSKSNLGMDRLSINVEATSSSSGGGILAKLFGGAPKALGDERPETIDITSKEPEKLPIDEHYKDTSPDKKR